MPRPAPGGRRRIGARTLATLLVLPLAFAPACRVTPNPATGRPEVVLLSTEEEQELGEQGARAIEAREGVVRDDRIASYVRRLGAHLAQYSPRKDVEYSFHVVETDEPNAFALPGGHIYVSRGALVLANSEAEIANVLAHEIAHVAARHAAQRHAHQTTFGLATWVGALAGGGTPGEQTAQAEDLTTGGAPAYARNQEREADQVGQDIAVQAGVDPRGMARFLRSLESATRLEIGHSAPRGYLATHPATKERVAEMATRAETLRAEPWFAIAATRADYLNLIDGMPVRRPASEGVILGNRFLHPDLDLQVRFPPGWRIANQASQVIAVSRKGDAVALLQLQSDGEDPVAAAEEFAAEGDLALSDGVAVRIGGLPAFRARARVPSPAGVLRAEITWVAHGGRIYRLTAGTREGKLRSRDFRSFSRSFRRLSEADRRQITELRLRRVLPEPGETLAELSARTANHWDLNTTAVVNELFVGERLESERWVKIAVLEPYESASAAADEAEPAADDRG